MPFRGGEPIITAMSDDRFSRPFKYMEKRDSVDVRFGSVEEGLADLRGAVTELSVQVRDYCQETILLTRQMERMREAIKHIAAETGVKLMSYNL